MNSSRGVLPQPGSQNNASKEMYGTPSILASSAPSVDWIYCQICRANDFPGTNLSRSYRPPLDTHQTRLYKDARDPSRTAVSRNIYFVPALPISEQRRQERSGVHDSLWQAKGVTAFRRVGNFILVFTMTRIFRCRNRTWGSLTFCMGR